MRSPYRLLLALPVLCAPVLLVGEPNWAGISQVARAAEGNRVSPSTTISRQKCQALSGLKTGNTSTTFACATRALAIESHNPEPYDWQAQAHIKLAQYALIEQNHGNRTNDRLGSSR